jgi:hypothetical protein
MVGNDVHMMVDRMYIGGGFISNLIALANGLRLTGGIKRYTLSRGYYLNNISNNFAGGKMGRYGYGNYLDATAREKLDGTDAVKLDGDQLAPASLEQDKVGDFYSTNYRPQNSELGFYSVDDFSLLGELIRNRNLINNADVDYAKIRYGEEGADNKFIARNARSTDIGKEEIHTYLDTDYDALFGERNPLSKSGGKYRANLLNFSDSVSDSIGLLNRNIELYEKSRPLNGVYNGDDITPEIPRTGTETFKSGVEFGNTEFYHLINDIGYKVREKYKEYNDRTDPYIYSELERLEALKAKHKDAQLSIFDLLGQQRKKSEKEREIDEMFNAFYTWERDSIEIKNNPYIQIIAVVTGVN